MYKFADDTKLCTDIMELQEDINKLVEWATKWQMSFNVDTCSVMHISHNNMQGNYKLYHVLSTVADNRSTAGSSNHDHPRPQ